MAASCPQILQGIITRSAAFASVSATPGRLPAPSRTHRPLSVALAFSSTRVEALGVAAVEIVIRTAKVGFRFPFVRMDDQGSLALKGGAVDEQVGQGALARAAFAAEEGDDLHDAPRAWSVSSRTSIEASCRWSVLRVRLAASFNNQTYCSSVSRKLANLLSNS